METSCEMIAAGFADWALFAYDLVHSWQTLIAGVLALSAAYYTIRTIKRQGRLQQAQLNEERERFASQARRKALVAKAVLPDALDEICGFTEEVAHHLMKKPERIQLPTRPSEAVDALKTVIEFVDDDTAGSIAEVLNYYQVYMARCRKATTRAIRHGQFLTFTARLRWHCLRLFSYARGEADSVPYIAPTRDALESAMSEIVDHQLHEKDVYLLAIRYLKRTHPE